MCIGTISLLILAITIMITFIKWNTPVVTQYFGKEVIMLLIGIGACCVLIFIVVAPPSITVCVFQRVGMWLCFSFTFGALFIQTVDVTSKYIHYKLSHSAKRPRFSGPKYQIMFTMGVVFGQLILVVIGLGIDPPVVKRISFIQQAGDAPEIFEICRQPHTAILVLSFTYISSIIFASAILSWIIRKIWSMYMFTSFTLMVVWVLFQTVYFSAKIEFQTGILAIGIALSYYCIYVRHLIISQITV